MARIVVFEQYGGPDVLHVVEVDDPTPGPGEVRVRIRAGGVQPVDASFRSGAFHQYMPARFPAQLGNEAAGTIDAIGSDVSGLAVGDDVITFLDSTGYADTTLTAADRVVAKPAEMTWPEAGVLSVSGQTADTALDALAVTTGDHVLVHAAAGGVGSYAIQLAVARGATVIGTASPHNHAYLTDLGATPVAHGPGLAERIRALTPTPITAALDCIGGQANDISVELLGSPDRAITLVDWAAEQRIGVRRVGTDRSAARLAGLTTLYQAGELTIALSATYALAEAADAHRQIETGHVRGKIAMVTP